MAEFQTNACGTICLCLLNLLAIRCLQLWSQPMGPLCLWQCFVMVVHGGQRHSVLNSQWILFSDVPASLALMILTGSLTDSSKLEIGNFAYLTVLPPPPLSYSIGWEYLSGLSGQLVCPVTQVKVWSFCVICHSFKLSAFCSASLDRFSVLFEKRGSRISTVAIPTKKSIESFLLTILHEIFPPKFFPVYSYPDYLSSAQLRIVSIVHLFFPFIV